MTRIAVTLRFAVGCGTDKRPLTLEIPTTARACQTIMVQMDGPFDG